MTEVITTFSKDGYELYGKKMIDSWSEFWPDSHRLTVYTEGYELLNLSKNVRTLDLDSCCPDLAVFKSSSIKMLRDNDKKHNNRIKKTIKWCHKVYAMSHALKTSTHDYLIFLDGDTRTIKTIPKNIASKLVLNNLFAVHFETLKNRLHFETGLVVFNLHHTLKTWLAQEIVKPYDTMAVYNMEKTWDGFVLADIWKKYNLPVTNLSAGCAGVFCNPLVKSFIQHDVGPKKYQGTDYDRYLGKKNDL